MSQAHLRTDIALFLYHLSRSVSHGTLLVYLAAIRYHHLQQGLGDPLSQQPLLAYLCKGIKRHQGTRGRVRLPLSASLLSALQPHLQQSPYLGRLNQLAVWAALTLVFHAFLRASEFLPPQAPTPLVDTFLEETFTKRHRTSPSQSKPPKVTPLEQPVHSQSRPLALQPAQYGQCAGSSLNPTIRRLALSSHSVQASS